MIEREAPEGLRDRLREAREVAGRTAVELRRIVAALSPAVLERLGLPAAVRQLAGRFQAVNHAQVHLRLGLGKQRASLPVEEVLYRATQECLHNVARHSGASDVNLSLRSTDKKIRLSVVDNGVGFCAERMRGKPRSFGLAGMRERAALLGGRLEVQSKPGQGASIMLELPLTPAPAGSHGKDSRIVG
jgi:two-component system sensor histidine kinase UhpB